MSRAPFAPLLLVVGTICATGEVCFVAAQIHLPQGVLGPCIPFFCNCIWVILPSGFLHFRGRIQLGLTLQTLIIGVGVGSVAAGYGLVKLLRCTVSAATGGGRV